MPRILELNVSHCMIKELGSASSQILGMPTICVKSSVFQFPETGSLPLQLKGTKFSAQILDLKSV